MFELTILSPRRILLRIGRWRFRTWHGRFTLLPRGYRAPELCWQVQEDDTGRRFGAFFSVAQAERCAAQMRSEGHSNLQLNATRIYTRAADWQFDRISRTESRQPS